MNHGTAGLTPIRLIHSDEAAVARGGSPVPTRACACFEAHYVLPCALVYFVAELASATHDATASTTASTPSASKSSFPSSSRHHPQHTQLQRRERVKRYRGVKERTSTQNKKRPAKKSPSATHRHVSVDADVSTTPTPSLQNQYHNPCPAGARRSAHSGCISQH